MKKAIVPLLVLIALASIATMQNCGGTRSLFTNLDVSRATIDTQLSSMGTSVQSDTASATSIAIFFQILQEPDSVLFYAEAPGSMGNMDTVMPIDFATFELQTPSKAYAYYVYSPTNGPHGALIIATGNDTTQTPIIAMANDGQNFAPGVFSDANFVMEMGIGQGSLDVESYDIIDNDFAQTIQLEIYNYTDSGKEFLGPILLTQPTN